MTIEESSEYLETANDCTSAIDCSGAIRIPWLLYDKYDKFIEEPFFISLRPGHYLDIPNKISSSEQVSTILDYLATLAIDQRERLENIPPDKERNQLYDDWDFVLRQLLKLKGSYPPGQVVAVTETYCRKIQDISQYVQEVFYYQLFFTLYKIAFESYRAAEKKLISITLQLAQTDMLIAQYKNFQKNYGGYQAQVEKQIVGSAITTLISIINIWIPGVANTIISISVTAINSFLDNTLGVQQADNENSDKIGRANDALKIVNNSFKGKKIDAGTKIAVNFFKSFNDAMDELETLEKRYNEIMPQLSRLEKNQSELLAEQFRCLKEFTGYKEMIAAIQEGKEELQKLLLKE